MAQVYLGIGSNVDRERHIAMGLLALRQAFGELQVSKVYRCKAVGFDGEDFYNLAVGLRSDHTPDQIRDRLREIEDRFGRDRNQPRFSDRTLDIDLLLYGDTEIDSESLKVPRDEVLKQAYVLKPLVDIAADFEHPQTGRSLSEHWGMMETDPEDLTEVPILGLQ